MIFSDLQQWWPIIFQISYDTPLFIIYIVTFYIVITKRYQYKSSFFSIFLAAAPGNMMHFIVSLVSVRVPVRVCGNCTLARFYREALTPCGSSLLIFLLFQQFFTFQAHMLLMALNRLSAIYKPIRYENIWSVVVLPLCLASYILPLPITYPLLLYPSHYLYFPHVKGHFLKFSGDIQPIFAFLIRFILLLTPCTLLVNLLSAYLFIQRKSRNRAENALLFTSISHFIIQSAVAVYTTAFAFASRDAHRKEWISRFAVLGYPYVSDLASFTSPLFLIAFSRQLRSDVLDVFKCRFQRRSPLGRQLSRRSLRKGIASIS